jgi:hypothetical protein
MKRVMRVYRSKAASDPDCQTAMAYYRETKGAGSNPADVRSESDSEVSPVSTTSISRL